MRIVHIIPGNTAITDGFDEFINSKFDKESHTFIALRKSDKLIQSNTITIKDKFDFIGLVRMIYHMNCCEKIIIHGLFSIQLTAIFFLQSWILKKSYWVIWGGDLYRYLGPKNKVKDKLHELMRKYVIKNMGNFITHIKGDYELVKKWYGSKGKYYYSFTYGSNLYNDKIINIKEEVNNKVCIQVGNSADPSNNHCEVFNKLRKFKDMDIEIICPLSYGDKKYASRVINYGSEVFGDKFKPIIDFKPIDEYLKILSKIEIAIFNHKRQQAMGNITTLLGNGKKVYIRDDITTWGFCFDHNLKVYRSNGDFKELFTKMDYETVQKNIKNVSEQFTEEKLIMDLKIIFDS
ncbi:MAG: TDP-N-acetylfucosamine:lipid II N-acetylfucosaminyltransferase [Firmicutes bacterium]|jgi:hypothetical protein|nr:TDP-N-acetylfucosamine:lipid II N-acetylfucosaminyltransferase [Bacillota bacterium]